MTKRLGGRRSSGWRLAKLRRKRMIDTDIVEAGDWTADFVQPQQPDSFVPIFWTLILISILASVILLYIRMFLLIQ